MDDRFELEMVCSRLDVSLPEAATLGLLTYVNLLRKWQPAQNLVGPSTLDEIWTRHVADSLQVLPILERCLSESIQGVDELVRLVDLGSGAGLPGVVVAAALGPRLGEATLVESNGRKAAFLRAVSRETGIPITVRQARIEDVENDALPRADILTALKPEP